MGGTYGGREGEGGRRMEGGGDERKGRELEMQMGEGRMEENIVINEEIDGERGRCSETELLTV